MLSCAAWGKTSSQCTDLAKKIYQFGFFHFTLSWIRGSSDTDILETQMYNTSAKRKMKPLESFQYFPIVLKLIKLGSDLSPRLTDLDYILLG